MKDEELEDAMRKRDCVYNMWVKRRALRLIVPAKATMKQTIIPSTEANSRKDIEGAQNLLRIARQVI
uniref:Probable amino-acid racemase n=1 Tax=Tanacetum cinerariifolium TaxID=118510 RepID=A0A699HAX2_TANCI|nr:probable amino-acid racemase [Tanacetum cinerariifolium]